MTLISASLMPRVVSAGVPTRIPDGLSGGLVSQGMDFLLTVIPALPSARLLWNQDALLEDIDERRGGVVSAAGDEAVAGLPQTISQRPGVGDDLRGVGAKFGAQHFGERDSFSSDAMHERATLLAGENRPVNFLAESLIWLCADHHIFADDDEAGARAAQGLVRGGCSDVRVGHRRRMNAARYETRDVRHVEDVIRAHLIGDLAHARKIPEISMISAGAADDDLRLFLERNRFEFVVVDCICIAADVVEGGPIELAGEAEPVAMREVAAVRQIEAQNRVARLQDCRQMPKRLPAGRNAAALIWSPPKICLARSRARFSTTSAILASAHVVAAAGVALGIFVREDGTGCL